MNHCLPGGNPLLCCFLPLQNPIYTSLPRITGWGTAYRSQAIADRQWFILSSSRMSWINPWIFPRTTVSNVSYVTLDCFCSNPVLFLMVVSPRRQWHRNMCHTEHIPHSGTGWHRNMCHTEHIPHSGTGWHILSPKPLHKYIQGESLPTGRTLFLSHPCWFWSLSFLQDEPLPTAWFGLLIATPFKRYGYTAWSILRRQVTGPGHIPWIPISRINLCTRFRFTQWPRQFKNTTIFRLP